MSYKLFIFNSIIALLLTIISFNAHILDPEMEYAIYSGFVLIIVFGTSIAGITLGFQNRANPNFMTKNKIGLYGNLTYCLLILLLMIASIA